MERWMYLLEATTAEQLKTFQMHLREKGKVPLSLRELLRSGAEEACGILLSDVSEQEIPAMVQFAFSHKVPVTLVCGNEYSNETMRFLTESRELTLIPKASFLLHLLNTENPSVLKAQAVYLDLPWTKPLETVLRACRTRVLITKNATLQSAITASGIYCIPARKTGEPAKTVPSSELPIEKYPLFTSFPLAPRMSLLSTVEEILSCTFTRLYHPYTDRYRLKATIPFVTERECEPSADFAEFLRSALEQNCGILLHQKNGEELFLYGIHSGTDCFSAYDSAWKPLLINRHTTRILAQTRSVTLLRYEPGRTEPHGELFTDALKEEEALSEDNFTGRTAAVRYLNAFSSEEQLRDTVSLQIFLEERLLLAEALKWFAGKENLYIDHLEHHLSLLETVVLPILKTLRTGDREIAPARRLQWGDSLRHLFASEEICLRQCVEERQRMKTYLLWAEEFRKKS